MENMPNWTDLPDDVITRIAAKDLTEVEDLVAFSAVCQSWKSTAAAARKEQCWSSRKTYQQPPWLMLSEMAEEEEEDRRVERKRGFFSLYKKKKHYLDLPETRGRRCWGSPHGWILTLGLDLQIHLLNPLTRRRIPLPPTPSFQSQVEWSFPPTPRWMRSLFIDRAIILSVAPSSSSSSSSYSDDDDEEELSRFLVVATLNQYSLLAVARPREKTWLTVVFDSSSEPEGVNDVSWFNGQVFALCSHGRLALLSNLEGPDPPKATYISPPAPEDIIDCTEKLYLLESSGELLMVVRYLNLYHIKTEGFDVYRFDFGDKTWIEMEDLGNCALFVGDNCSMSVSISDHHNCRSNCIYFTDDNHEQWRGDRASWGDLGKGGDDMGVFDFRSMTIEPYYDGDDIISLYSSPLWLIPNFD